MFFYLEASLKSDFSSRELQKLLKCGLLFLYYLYSVLQKHRLSFYWHSYKLHCSGKFLLKGVFFWDNCQCRDTINLQRLTSWFFTPGSFTHSHRRCTETFCFYLRLDVLSRYIYIQVSQEECEILRESVPYVKLYRYNPKHLYPKLNGYGDNGQRSLKLWHLLHTYWLANSYWNWQEYVVSVMLISVLNIKVTCEWHIAIKLNYKNSRIHVFALT